jgi:hypothetical protein
VPHALPAQHGCPTPPHATHDPPEHTLPALHVLPEQHGCPVAPQMHRPPEQVAVPHERVHVPQ